VQAKQGKEVQKKLSQETKSKEAKK
jgi:hypothetical protein